MIDLLISKRLKFAISEQNNNKILEIAKSRNLNIFTVKTILNQVNQSYRKEILITNYDLYKKNSFF
jgi:predicted patatin/cPLA2 family phospholipase